MEDKLAAIEERFEQSAQSSTPLAYPGAADDVRWLITEVRRLRLLSGEQRRLANMRSRSHWAPAAAAAARQRQQQPGG